MMLIAVVVGSMSTYLGLLASYWYDVAASATIVLVAVGIFFVVLLLTNLGRPSRADGRTDAETGETLP
jgi:ABC-type Mn2+/Zn2+ transport system permease subunit